MAQFLASAVFRVMGHVTEADTAWVVYRVTAAAPGNPTASQVSLVALRNVGGTWKVRLNEEVKGMLTGLRAAAAEARARSTAEAQVRAGHPAARRAHAAAPRAPLMPVQPHALPDAEAAGRDLADLCVRAVTTAAWDLRLDPALFAEELAQGEIGMMIHLLAEAGEHVDDLELRARIDTLLHRLTAWTESAEDS